MLTYILLFATTTILFYIAQKAKSKSDIAFYAISFFAIFLLAFIAGCRDRTVGTDVWFYGEKVFAAAKYSNSLLECIQANYDIETFYATINYISAIFTDRIGLALFLTQLIQSILVFFFFNRYIKDVPLWLLMLCYCFLYYNITLNLMRQGVAIAFVAFFMKFFYERKYALFFLTFVFCWFVHHSTAAIGLMLSCIYYVTSFEENKQKKFMYLAIIFAIAFFFLFGGLLQLFSQIESMGKYSAYGANSRFKSSVSIANVFTRLFFLVLIIIDKFIKGDNTKLRNTLLFFLIVDLFSLSLGKYTYYTSRIALYFLILEIPLVLTLIYKSKITERTRTIFIVLTIFVCIFNWYWINVLRGENATIPYTSYYLGIE